MNIHEAKPHLCVGGPLDGMHFVRAPWNPVRIGYAGGFYHITDTREHCGCTRWEWHDESTPTLPALLPALLVTSSKP